MKLREFFFWDIYINSTMESFLLIATKILPKGLFTELLQSRYHGYDPFFPCILLLKFYQKACSQNYYKVDIMATIPSFLA